MFKRAAMVIALILVTQSVLAQGKEKLIGTWKLLAFEAEFQATGERRPVFGNNPTGHLMFAPEGRMMLVIAGEGQKPAQTDQDRADLLRTMFAFSGIYRADGEKLTTKVDVSWNQAWTGTEQVRFYKLDGDRLDIISAWLPDPMLPGNPIARGILSWERVR